MKFGCKYGTKRPSPNFEFGSLDAAREFSFGLMDGPRMDAFADRPPGSHACCSYHIQYIVQYISVWDSLNTCKEYN